MSISILSSTNYSYTGQADTRAYSSATGTGNTLLVVVVMGQGFAAVPTSRAVSYNGVAMTSRVYVSPGYTGFGQIWTLASPATGSNTLFIDYSNGSNGGVHVAVYTLDGVSNAPIDSTNSSNIFSGFADGVWLDTLSLTPNSSPTLLIDGFISTDGSWSNVYTGQTNNGLCSSYKNSSSLSSVSIYGTSPNFLRPNIAHVAVLIREDKSFSVSDNISSGDSSVAVKGFLALVSDSLKISETYTQIRKVFMTFTDTITIKNRGWFGKLLFWRNTTKNTSNFNNQIKH